ncbi:DUF3237 domain-containing protein [Hominifimenecus sp. rT4P-3]|uniref:DUF3237 domain-containing protein n=1 Tax=Hominifimenecus sp. rT4P-3 TaxID=3242979 RepID=UPI003DA44E5F
MDVTLNAKLVFSLSVDCAPALEVGKNDEGCLFVIPITGGTFSGDGMGEGIRGKILPGGADWNTRYGVHAPEQVDASRVFAKYLIQTDDGVLIHVENEGFKSWKPGEQTKIVTNPRFQVQAGKYGWLNYGVYVGSLQGREDKSGVEINIYRME